MSRPDPFDAGGLLRAAVEAHREVTGESAAYVCRDRCVPPIAPESLSRAYGRKNASPVLVRAICRALGLRVVLAREEGERT